LEVFAEFISSLLSLSDDCGEFWLSGISQSMKAICSVSVIVFYLNATSVTCLRGDQIEKKQKQTM